MAGQFQDQVALVTGAASGIGAAVAAALAREGASVAATDIAPMSPAAYTWHLDVTDGAEVAAVVNQVERQLGPIDVLVNVAGVLEIGPVTTTSDAAWQRVFAVNATGVFQVSREIAARMVARRSGTIVTVSSNAGGVPRATMAAYAASKAAATHFTKSLALELAPYGVRCNVVSPGSTDTPMQRSMWTDANAAQAVITGDSALFKPGIPLGRIAAPDDVAAAVIFLASPAARHLTMQEIVVDGGASLR